MKILTLSDLHLDQWSKYALQFDVTTSNPDLVVLAGDIHQGVRAVDWAKKTFAGLPVIYIHGNHEAYGMNLDEVIRDLRQACAGTNVHFLHMDEIVLEGVRYLGSCLWTDFKLLGDDTRQAAMRESEDLMNDYRLIRIRLAAARPPYRKLRAADTARFHAEQRAWLQKKLDEPFEGKTVVVTHMAPSMRSVPDEYATDPVSAAFSSRLDHLVEKADLWIHGHTHTSMDYEIGKCRVVANPCGYRLDIGCAENEWFNPNFIVEV